MRYHVGLAPGHTYAHNWDGTPEPSGQPNDLEQVAEDHLAVDEVDNDYESDYQGSMNSMDCKCNLSSSDDGSGDELGAEDKLDDDEFLIMDEMY